MMALASRSLAVLAALSVGPQAWADVDTKGEILWTYDARGCLFSSPAIVGDTVFLAPCRGVLLALDKSTGKLLWSHDASEGGRNVQFHGDPLFTGDMVVIGSDTDDASATAHVLALDRPSGKLKWKHPVGRGVSSDIVLDGDRLWMTTRENELICLDLATGQRLSEFRSTPAPAFLFSASATPVLTRDRIFFAASNGMVHALDRASMKEIWKFDAGAPVVSTPLLRPDTLYVPAQNGRILRLDRATGKRMGELSTAGLLVGPPVFASDHLLVFSATGENEGELLAIDPDLKEVRWRRRPEGTRWTSARPYLRGNGILVGSGTGRIVGLAPADGSDLWSDTLPGTVRGIGWDQDVLYVGMMDGTLYAYRPPLTPAASPPAP
jgi:outer membrane protein assembly factor BamB